MIATVYLFAGFQEADLYEADVVSITPATGGKVKMVLNTWRGTETWTAKDSGGGKYHELAFDSLDPSKG